MSGSSGTTIVMPGDNTIDVGTLANVEAVQTAGTHVGTPNISFPFAFNGATLNFLANEPFIADAKLYAALNASATATANITWSN